MKSQTYAGLQSGPRENKEVVITVIGRRHTLMLWKMKNYQFSFTVYSA